VEEAVIVAAALGWCVGAAIGCWIMTADWASIFEAFRDRNVPESSPIPLEDWERAL
jgi:hypothetical protein